jgi:hypothetical protein
VGNFSRGEGSEEAGEGFSVKTLLVYDLSFQVYRACAAHPMLRSGRTFTGGVYGFLTTLSKIVRETKATHIALGEDVKPYKRSETYPEYKQIRKKNADSQLADDFNDSWPMVVDLLQECGFQLWSVKGFEFDDLAGHCVRKYRHRFDVIYAASNDSDLFQLFGCERFKVFRDDKSGVMDRDRLFKETGLTPDQFMLASALAGTHNDIEGVNGIGPKKSAAAVLNPAVWRDMQAKHGELIKRNLSLIKLPHDDFPRDECIPALTKGFNTRALYRFCARYDIEVTASMVNALEQLHTG